MANEVRIPITKFVGKWGCDGDASVSITRRDGLDAIHYGLTPYLDAGAIVSVVGRAWNPRSSSYSSTYRNILVPLYFNGTGYVLPVFGQPAGTATIRIRDLNPAGIMQSGLTVGKIVGEVDAYVKEARGNAGIIIVTAPKKEAYADGGTFAAESVKEAVYHLSRSWANGWIFNIGVQSPDVAKNQGSFLVNTSRHDGSPEIKVDGAAFNSNLGSIGIPPAAAPCSALIGVARDFGKPYAMAACLGIQIDGACSNNIFGRTVSLPLITTNCALLSAGRGATGIFHNAAELGRALPKGGNPVSTGFLIGTAMLPHEAAHAMTSAVEAARTAMMDVSVAEVVRGALPVHYRQGVDAVVAGAAIGFAAPANTWNDIRIISFATDALNVMGRGDDGDIRMAGECPAILADCGAKEEALAAVDLKGVGIAAVIAAK